MASSIRRWARPALGGSVILAYALLMIIAIRSVRHDAEGLRVLWPAVVMGLAAVALRRRPVLVLVAMIAGAIAVTVTMGAGDVTFAPRVAVVVAVGAVAANRRPRVGVIAAAVALAALVGGEIFWRAVQADGDAGWHRIVAATEATSAMLYTLMIGVGLTIGLLIRQRREHTDAMREQATAQAIIGERLRIARELHDSVAHGIGIIALQAGAARRVFDTQPARAREALGVVETAGRDALAELRRMLGALRDADESEPSTGLADLDRLASVATAAGVRVEVRRHGTPPALPPEIDRSAFRIIQEAVTNVVRHAGADSCRVIVDCRDETLSVEILDDGQGRPGPPGVGYGLVGMRERVALLHGDFSAGPRAEGGFRVAARLPLPVGVR